VAARVLGGLVLGGRVVGGLVLGGRVVGGRVVGGTVVVGASWAAIAGACVPPSSSTTMKAATAGEPITRGT
jgi:hypothetical protein